MTAHEIERLGKLLQGVRCEGCGYNIVPGHECPAALGSGQAPCDAARQWLELQRIDGQLT